VRQGIGFANAQSAKSEYFPKHAVALVQRVLYVLADVRLMTA